MYNMEISGTSFRAYCDMDAVDPYDGSVGGWTILESYSRANYASYIQQQPFSNNAPRNEDPSGSSDINWPIYRMSKARMGLVFAGATRMHARCAIQLSDSPDDHFFASKSYVFGSSSGFNSGFSTMTNSDFSGRYRGLEMAGTSFTVYTTNYDFHMSPPSPWNGNDCGADGECQGNGGAIVSSEDGFGWTTGHRGHRCFTAAGYTIFAMK